MLEAQPNPILEPEVSQVIESVPLSALIDMASSHVARLSTLYKSPKEIIQAEMRETPRLGRSVLDDMQEALTPEEAKLIGETALTVYNVVKATPPPIKEYEYEGKRSLRGKYQNGSVVMAMEDDIFTRTQGDKNAIYNLLVEDMGRRPALAAYVAGQMRNSVSLEEANLVGQTALATYKTMDFILELPVE